MRNQTDFAFESCKFTKKRDGKMLIEFYENEQDVGKKSKTIVTISFRDKEDFDKFCVWLISQK